MVNTVNWKWFIFERSLNSSSRISFRIFRSKISGFVRAELSYFDFIPGHYQTKLKYKKKSCETLIKSKY